MEFFKSPFKSMREFNRESLDEKEKNQELFNAVRRVDAKFVKKWLEAGADPKYVYPKVDPYWNDCNIDIFCNSHYSLSFLSLEKINSISKLLLYMNDNPQTVFTMLQRRVNYWKTKDIEEMKNDLLEINNLFTEYETDPSLSNIYRLKGGKRKTKKIKTKKSKKIKKEKVIKGNKIKT